MLLELFPAPKQHLGGKSDDNVQAAGKGWLDE
jgi:hypothetical protein